MQRYHFRSDIVPSETRWLAWSQTLSHFAVDTAVERMDGTDNATSESTVNTCVTPSGISFTVLESRAPQRISSTSGKVEEVFWLSLILRGEAVLDLGGDPILMSPGDILYGKRGVPSSAQIGSGFRMLLVNIPGEILARKVLLPLPNRAIHLSGRAGVGRVLSRMLSAVADSLDDLDEALTGPVEAALPQFLLSSLFGGRSEPALGGAAAIRAGVLQRVWQAIELRLDEGNLSIAKVADDQGLPVRYVQKLFEEAGLSFSAYVRRRRLEQCRADLANPLNADVSITSTCFRWGFNDAATFSRAFREEFGTTPRDYRRSCLAAAAAHRAPQRFRGLQRLTA